MFLRHLQTAKSFGIHPNRGEDVDAAQVKLPVHGAHLDLAPYLDGELLAGFLEPATLECEPFVVPAPRACARLPESQVVPFASKLDDAGLLLIVEGEDVLLDRRMAENLRSLLVHLVRNAVDHGFEDAAARKAAGKPERPSLRVSCAARGIRVEFTIEDDGEAERRACQDPNLDADV